MSNVYDNILGLIGHTPMVKLNTVTKDIPATIYAKLESYNPDIPPKTESHFIL